MILSHQNRFIFIHNVRTGGTSIRNALLGRGLCESVGRQHMSARMARAHLGKEKYGKLFRFGFVRNPYDWICSLYHFIIESPTHGQHETAIRLGSFERYLEWRHDNNRRSQSWWFEDDSGSLMVDFIGRYENLRQDFGKICSYLGLGNILLSHTNKSNHKNYKSLYNGHMIDIAKKTFARDIERFGYDFNGWDKSDSIGFLTNVKS